MLMVVFVTTLFFLVSGMGVILLRDQSIDFFVMGIVGLQQVISESSLYIRRASQHIISYLES